jgi:hypothetical protein
VPARLRQPVQLALFAWIKRNPAGDRRLDGLFVMDEAQTLAPSGAMTACRIADNSRRIRSPESALRIDSTNSSKADWSRAIALSSLRVLRSFSQSFTRWSPTSWTDTPGPIQ